MPALLALLITNLPAIASACATVVPAVSDAIAAWSSAKPATVSDAEWNALLLHTEAPKSEDLGTLIAWAQGKITAGQ